MVTDTLINFITTVSYNYVFPFLSHSSNKLQESSFKFVTIPDLVKKYR